MGITMSFFWSMHALIFTSSSKHHFDSVYPSEKITNATFDSFILSNRLIRNLPLSSCSSINTLMSLSFKAGTRKLMKLLRTSFPLKLMNTWGLGILGSWDQRQNRRRRSSGHWRDFFLIRNKRSSIETVYRFSWNYYRHWSSLLFILTK